MMAHGDNPGLSLLQAMEKYSDPELWAKYQRACPPDGTGPITYYDPRAIRSLGLKPEHEALLKQLGAKFIDLLHSEALWAIGYATPVELDAEPVLIPPDKWEILRPNVKENSAVGGGLSFSGVRVFDSQADAKEHSSAGKKSTQQKNRGGRPPKYDWEAFFVEITVRADLDSLPNTQAELERDMAEWCFDAWGEQPAESVIRDKISRIFKHPRKGGKEAGN
jgi:hypothetical protein